MSLVVTYSEMKTVPEGIYEARVDKIEKDENGKFGPSLKWYFTIVSPGTEHDGTSVSGMSSLNMNPKTKGYKWVKALGHVIQPGESFDVHSLLNSFCRVKVENTPSTKNGTIVLYSNVKDIAPIKRNQAQAAPAPVAQPAVAAPVASASAVPPTQRPVTQNQITPEDLGSDEDFGDDF